MCKPATPCIPATREHWSPLSSCCEPAKSWAGCAAPRSSVRGPSAIAASWLRRGRHTFPRILLRETPRILSTLRCRGARRRLRSLLRRLAVVPLHELSGRSACEGELLTSRPATSRRLGSAAHRRKRNQPCALGIAGTFWRTRTGAHSGEHLVQSSRRAPGRSPKGRGSHLFLFRHRCRLRRQFFTDQMESQSTS
jgi:hypothetical protein